MSSDSEESSPFIGKEETQSSIQEIPEETTHPIYAKVKRRKWILLSLCCALCLCLAIALILLFLVIIPKIAQDVADDADFSFDSIMILNPTNQSVLLNATVTIHSSFFLSISGKTKQTKLSLYYGPREDGLLGISTLPAITIKTGTENITLANLLDIANITIFSQFALDSFQHPFISLRLKAKPTVTVGGLKEVMILDKNITVPAANNFDNNVEIVSFDLSNSNATDVNFLLQVRIYNPSFIQVESLGNLSFLSFYQNISMGSFRSCGPVALYSGYNLVRAEGSFRPANLSLFGELISRYLAGRTNTLVAHGDSSSIGLWNDTLHYGSRPFSFSATVNGNTTQLIENITIAALEIVPWNESAIVVNDFSTVLTVAQPLGPNSPNDIQRVKLNADVTFKQILNDSYWYIGQLVAPEIPVANGSGVNINVTVPTAYIVFNDSGRNFQYFASQLISQNTVTLVLGGTADITAKVALGTLNLTAIPANVAATITAGGDFKNITFNSFSLPKDYPAGGVELIVNLTVWNPTVGSLYLGNATFAMLYQGQIMGQVYGSNVTLTTGAITLQLTGYVKPNGSAALAAASDLISNYANGVASPVSAQGVESSLGISWLDSLMKSVTLNADLPGNTAQLIQEVNVTLLGLEWIGANNDIMVMNSSLVIGYQIPFGFTYAIHQFGGIITFNFNGTDFASVTVPVLPVTVDTQTQQIFVNFSLLEVDVLDVDAFADFAVALLLSPSATANVKGLANTVIESTAGNLTLQNISLNKDITLVGINSFQSGFYILGANIVGGQAGYLYLELSVVVYNPTAAIINAGLFGINLFYEGVFVGNGTIADLAVGPGNNTYTAFGTVVLNSDNSEQLFHFLSSYAMGYPVTCTVRGIENSTTHPVLKKAISELALNVTLPGVKFHIIQFARAGINIIDFFKGYIPTQITVLNPFSVKVTLLHAFIDIFLNGTFVGTVNTDLNITIPQNATAITPYVNIDIEKITWEEIEALIGDVWLDINGTLKADFGDGFVVDFDYIQNGIPASVWNSSLKTTDLRKSSSINVVNGNDDHILQQQYIIIDNNDNHKLAKEHKVKEMKQKRKKKNT